jgi:hypothetical protein
VSVFYSKIKEINDQWGSAWLCTIMEYNGRLWSALGTFGVPCGVWEKLAIKVWIN